MKKLGQNKDDKSLAAVVSEKRAKLESQLKEHYRVLKIIAPGLVGRVSLIPDAPHKDRILLPSFFTSTQRTTLGLTRLVTTEITLRVAQCYDTLEKLRKALGVRSFLSRHARHSNGYNNSTRAQASLRNSEHNVKQWAIIYRRSYKALLDLGASAAKRRTLRNLEESDLVLLSSWLENEEYKSKDKALPWIWTVAQQSSVSGSGDIVKKIQEWNEEGNTFCQAGSGHMSDLLFQLYGWNGYTLRQPWTDGSKRPTSCEKSLGGSQSRFASGKRRLSPTHW